MSSFSFSEELKRFAEKADPEIVVKKVAMDVFRRVILRTPVDTGRARANWQASIGAPIEGEIESTDQNRGIVEAAQVIDNLEGDQSIFLSNNLPYIERLENGYSAQSPSGIVKVTLVEYPHIVEDAVNK